MQKNLLFAAPVADPHDHRSVIFFIRKDNTSRKQASKSRESCFIGDKCRCEQERGLLSVKICQLSVEFYVIMCCACNITGATGPGANPIDGLMHSRDDLRMLAHTQVVI